MLTAVRQLNVSKLPEITRVRMIPDGIPPSPPSSGKLLPSSRGIQTPTKIKLNLHNVKQIPVKHPNKLLTFWSKLPLKHKILIGIGLFMVICAIAIIPPVVVATSRIITSTTAPTTTTYACASTTCLKSLTSFHASTIAFWLFDSTFNDVNNIYTGFGYGSPSYSSTYAYLGQAIYLTGSSYVYVSTQFMNLTYQSFTIEGWIYLASVTSERGIFGQCASSTTTNQCLDLSVKSGHLHMGFQNDDISGATLLVTSKWYHVAFVYDSSSLQQTIYLNGVLDGTTAGSGTSSGPYLGTSGSTTIGLTVSSNYFSGYIDHLIVTSGAKTACQILNDATLTAYYPFDSGSYYDYGINYQNGNGNQLTSVTGRVNQGILFSATTSYFQTQGFTATAGYAASQPFTIALWVKPTSVVGGTLVHISTAAAGTTSGTYNACFDLLGLTSGGYLIAQIFTTTSCCYSSSTTAITGPLLSVNVWTHIVVSYSSSNGLKLYINSTLNSFSSSSLASFPTSVYTTQPYVTIGNASPSGTAPSCITSTSSPGVFLGIIDELYIYSRELTTTEICALANP
ncbi:unnamed protein product [Didymodactylos carnosus]|uniref:LamG-like jellyroll fold domain-containing protein n=1 Tax=Didymodactylos carnosus TaxID=1234261 RepID=A0A815F0Z5_9BILA|nr:unnamed protein product [Didymodactylos carnosus]CAF1319508.1 unnamed protein product [Didymodactylos carnosus]CAF3762734.1 unnamed protein product [Didymodactylos carnosus]CAF4164117.1 unnamed protein product [Didymodactylos carnosus]